MTAPFDEPAAQRINSARGAVLTGLLGELSAVEPLATGLDVGCGFGHFSAALAGAGLAVTALDGRPENVAEATRRHPGIRFLVKDVEDPALAGLGRFDVVSCFGLLYHLENPLAAVRNLAALTGRVLIAESVCVPAAEPLAVLYEEDHDVDQGLSYVALVPSEPWLVKSLYVAGFQSVYRPLRLPDHEDFRSRPGKRRRRTLLVASRGDLTLPSLEPMPEPRTRRHLWDALPLRLESERVRGVVKMALPRLRRRAGR